MTSSARQQRRRTNTAPSLRSAAAVFSLVTMGVTTTCTTTTSAFAPHHQYSAPERAFTAGSSRRVRSRESSSSPPPSLLEARRTSDGGGGNDFFSPPAVDVDAVKRSVASGVLAASVFLSAFAGVQPAFGENELNDRYGSGLDTSLVDQTCLVDKCSLQAKACLKDDPSCRKGLTCTAKCLGDNACITGCMARYGNGNLDNLLKCTIEDNECIKVAILPGGADPLGTEPRSPAPTVRNFDPRTLEGRWYKVVGYNPNYDCYACQRNSFSLPVKGGMFASYDPSQLKVDVEFSMPHLLPDGSPPPPSNVAEIIRTSEDGVSFGSKSIGLNDYSTRETMVFDGVGEAKNSHRRSAAATPSPPQQQQVDQTLVLNKGTDNELSYARTAHSEGEMFGLKFWENWYVIGENEPGTPEFKFVYYNGKTRQNTYEGAFVYSRNKELAPESMKKVYEIAKNAGMNPDQFCRIRNGCFQDDTVVKEPETGLGSPSNPFRGILASTRVSEFLGVEPVAARDTIKRNVPTAKVLQPPRDEQQQRERPWWYEVGDYLENPHRHFQAMDDLRVKMEWPEDVKKSP